METTILGLGYRAQERRIEWKLLVEHEMETAVRKGLYRGLNP